MWIPYSKRPSFAVSRRHKSSSDEEGMSNGGGHLLHEPVTRKVNSFNTTLSSLEIGHSSMQGYRVSMEDAYIAVAMKDLPDHIIVAILDGHAGSGASEYISERLADVIAETVHYQKYVNLEKNLRAESIDLLRVALVQAYIDIDKEFYNYVNMDGSGSTAVCAIVTPSHIVCANVGDSRCVVGTSDRKAISLSEDHKPQLADEKLRIEAAGGYVFMDRVNGELAMSRALGDYQYKSNADLDVDKQVVSCYPDIATHVRSHVDQVLVLACDGVWDVMSNVESIYFLQDVILAEDKDMSSEAMANALIELAFGSGSTDNISAVIVKLNSSEVSPSVDTDKEPVVAARSTDSTKKRSGADKKRKVNE